MTGVGSASSSGEEPFHLEKYRPACEAAKVRESDQVQESPSPYAPKSSQNEDTTHIRPALTGTSSKKKHFLNASVATALGRSKNKTGREEQAGFGTPSSSSRGLGYRRLSHSVVAKIKGLFNDDEVMPITKENMRSLSENPIDPLQSLKLHEPAQQSKVDLSRTSSLGSAIYNYDRHGVLNDNTTQVGTSNSNRRNSLGTDNGSLSRRVTIDSIIRRRNTNRDGELNQGGVRRMNDLERAHLAPNLLQLNSQAVAAGYRDISDRLKYDPEWGGSSLGHWVIDMASEGHSMHQQGSMHQQSESSSSSLIGDIQEFKDFDGVFPFSDSSSSQRESIDSEGFPAFTIEDSADATHFLPNPTNPRTSVSTRADTRVDSWHFNDNNLLPAIPAIPRQEQFSSPEPQSERSSFSSQQETAHHNRGISGPEQTVEQANPTHSTYLSDWLCSHCGFLNLPRRTACLQCWEERAESLGDIGRRNRRVTFAEPTKFEGKHASAMAGYNASLVDASLIPEPLKIKSCLKAKTQESQTADKSTQTGIQGSDGPASHQNQQTNATEATATSNEAEKTADDIIKEGLKEMEAIMNEAKEKNEIMRGLLELMEEIVQKKMSEKRKAKD
ncbi:hypothetical protein F5Y00DRAFT_271590 [Daldinia vernicosa]|uniref:uncharacterized protein n=1 Tax=Daldinia vernicosa TaxID=114800 RepID=UPI0020088B4A|nr:uncharacterized protein F5Y00DRAFT_271590 [Daldinia vernicosa]KAI0853099.1 hypothetical protein F5Y00DRAFT_271590 [Daldinia vernicosa]